MKPALLSLVVFALVAVAACEAEPGPDAGVGAALDAGPDDAGEGDEDAGALDAGPDAGTPCLGNCPGPPCPPPLGQGEPCCDNDGNVVSFTSCFEDAGVICFGGDTFSCVDDG